MVYPPIQSQVQHHEYIEHNLVAYPVLLIEKEENQSPQHAGVKSQKQQIAEPGTHCIADSSHIFL